LHAVNMYRSGHFSHDVLREIAAGVFKT
jgi:hypothetical protein